MTLEQRLQAIKDLADARLRNPAGFDQHTAWDLQEIVRLSTLEKPKFCKHCPFAEFVHPSPGCPGFEWDEGKS